MPRLKMEVDEDIKKIQNFLENLKSESGRNIVYPSNDIGSKHHKPNVPTTIGPKDKFKNLQISLEYNVECQSILNSLESSLLFLLEECLIEQKILRENIDNFDNRRGENKINDHPKMNTLRKASLSPYFKDPLSFPSQHNEDFSRRRYSGFLNPWDVIKTVAWTDEQKRSLEKSIEFCEKFDHTNSVINSNVVSDIDHNKSFTPSSSISNTMNVKEEEFDWIKISVINLNNARSPLECRAIWFNYLHPKINKKKWTQTESKTLKELVEHYKHQNWDEIACDLKTGRSAYQCIGHFKIRLADFSKTVWSAEELSLLEKFIIKFKFNNFTPWHKIALLMDGRSTSDIYRIWISKYGNIKKGTFSLQEDIILAAGLKEFGDDWCRIAQYLPNRQSAQVRGRIMVLKGRERDNLPWTKNEDDLVEKLVQKYGFGNWAKISTHFLSRSNIQIRIRYKTLSKRKAILGTGAALKSAETRPKPVNQERRLEALWAAAQKLIEKKKIKIDSSDASSESSIMYALSHIMTHRKKPGRKKGSVNFPSFRKEFYEFFHVAHSQRGGRGKDKCAEDKVPTLVHQVVLALQLLNAKIILPCEKDLVYQDGSILEMDKSVITFLIDRNELVSDNCKFIKFEGHFNNLNVLPSLLASPEDTSGNMDVEETIDWYPLCSPSASTMIGLRTMLLNRLSIKEQSKGTTVQENKDSSSIPSQYPTKSREYRSACMLWNKRLGILYTWAAFLSKMYPVHQFICDPVTEKEDVSNEEVTSTNKKKKRKKMNTNKSRNRDVKTMDGAVTEVKPKRSYVKSGQYKMQNQVSGSVRRNTRLTKIDS